MFLFGKEILTVNHSASKNYTRLICLLAYFFFLLFSWCFTRVGRWSHWSYVLLPKSWQRRPTSNANDGYACGFTFSTYVQNSGAPTAPQLFIASKKNCHTELGLEGWTDSKIYSFLCNIYCLVTIPMWLYLWWRCKHLSILIILSPLLECH